MCECEVPPLLHPAIESLCLCVCVFVGVGVGAFIRFWHMSNTYMHDACMQ